MSYTFAVKTHEHALYASYNHQLWTLFFEQGLRGSGLWSGHNPATRRL